MDENLETYNQSKNRNEQSDSAPTDPKEISDSKTSNMTNWKKEPSLSELQQDLEFARQETNDQKSNVEGWLDLRNTTGAEAPKKA